VFLTLVAIDSELMLVLSSDSLLIKEGGRVDYAKVVTSL